ncbi:MAG: endolytic transglycosylase MltG [Bacteroidota bacterium]
MLRKILIVCLLLGGLAGIYAWSKYKAVVHPNVPAELTNEFVKIPTNATFSEVVNILFENGQIIDTVSFREVSELMSYKKTTMRSGRFKIEAGWSNRQLIGHLRAGKQAPVKVVLSRGRFVEDIAGAAAKFIEADSASIVQLFDNQRFIEEKGYTKATLMSLFIPNTYEFFWNTSPEKFFNRMVKEHDRFWKKNNRAQKAEALGLTKAEVYTLASIVEKETNKVDEKDRIAGVYLNRLAKGIALQADPTAVFATRDFTARRILNTHINFDSPYNTYKYPGLPPGPISIASISSIDGVLNREQHDYYYFCAKPDNSGAHAFAKTLAGHNRNAKAFQNWLNKQRVFK